MEKKMFSNLHSWKNEKNIYKKFHFLLAPITKKMTTIYLDVAEEIYVNADFEMFKDR